MQKILKNNVQILFAASQSDYKLILHKIKINKFMFKEFHFIYNHFY